MEEFKFEVSNVELLTRRVGYLQSYKSFGDFTQHNHALINISYPFCKLGNKPYLTARDISRLFKLLEYHTVRYQLLNKYEFLSLLVFTEYFDVRIFRSYLRSRISRTENLNICLKDIIRYKSVLSVDSLRYLLLDICARRSLDLNKLMGLKPCRVNLYLRSRGRFANFHSEDTSLSCCRCRAYMNIPESLIQRRPSWQRTCGCYFCPACRPISRGVPLVGWECDDGWD